MPISDGIVLRICHGHACGRHSEQLKETALKYIVDNDLQDCVGIDEQSCFGRCFMGPNILIERWKNGQRNEKALLALMLNSKHPDMRYEHAVTVDDLPKLIDWHLQAWKQSR